MSVVNWFAFLIGVGLMAFGVGLFIYSLQFLNSEEEWDRRTAIVIISVCMFCAMLGAAICTQAMEFAS